MKAPKQWLQYVAYKARCNQATKYLKAQGIPCYAKHVCKNYYEVHYLANEWQASSFNHFLKTT